MMFKRPEKEEASNSTEGLILESAEDGWSTVTSKKNNKKNKGKNSQQSGDKEKNSQQSGDKEKNSQQSDDKENVIMTQSEVCTFCFCSGSSYSYHTQLCIYPKSVV